MMMVCVLVISTRMCWKFFGVFTVCENWNKEKKIGMYFLCLPVAGRNEKKMG